MPSYIFYLYGHGKLDLKFAHGRAEKQAGSNKICPKKVYISEAEIVEENNRTKNFGETGLFICGHIYSGKQLLPQIKNCCPEVLQNNWMTSPWPNHYWILVASRKTTTR